MGISKSNTPIWLKHNAEALHLSNSKGSKTDRMDVTKLPGNKPLDSKVNDQYLIALASDEIIEEGAGYTPFWKRQVAVKVGVVGEGTDTKIQYALLNRNSLIKRLSMDETTLDKYIEAGTVDEYIATRLEELSHIKSCFREANPTTGSKGEKQLRLDLAAQFPLKGSQIKDERSQYCVAMSRIEIRNEDNYCAGMGEIAVKVGTSEVIKDGKRINVHEYAILNMNSLIKRLGYNPGDPSVSKSGKSVTIWDNFKIEENRGKAHEFIEEILRHQPEKQNNINKSIIRMAKGEKIELYEENGTLGPRNFLDKLMQTYFRDDQELSDTFKNYIEEQDLGNDFNPYRQEFLQALTSKLWWTVPKDDLTEKEAFMIKSPAQIALKEPTTTADWDTEGKYTLTAAHDFIETSRINYDDLNKRGEIPMNCIFEPGTANEVSGWVIYKIEDLERLGFNQEDLEKYTTPKENFFPALHKRLEVLRKENAPLDDEDINRIQIIE